MAIAELIVEDQVLLGPEHDHGLVTPGAVIGHGGGVLVALHERRVHIEGRSVRRRPRIRNTGRCQVRQVVPASTPPCLASPTSMRPTTLHRLILRGLIFRGECGHAECVACVATLPKHRGARPAVLLRTFPVTCHSWQRPALSRITGVADSWRVRPSRSRNTSRSRASRKIFRRSIPRTIRCWRAPGASIRAWRGIRAGEHTASRQDSYTLMGVPQSASVAGRAG